jgi:hypothetical protein
MIFLGDRFLGNPDHVLFNEGVHARWKWLAIQKRGAKFKLINAMLKIQDFTEAFGCLPPIEALVEYITSERALLRGRYEQMHAEGVIASGMRREALYVSRFNLQPMDVALLKGRAAADAFIKDDHYDRGVYLRFLFEPNTFYSLSLLSSDSFFKNC